MRDNKVIEAMGELIKENFGSDPKIVEVIPVAAEIPPIETKYELKEGVYFHEVKKQYGVRIMQDGVLTHIGYVSTEEAAQAIYDERSD